MVNHTKYEKIALCGLSTLSKFNNQQGFIARLKTKPNFKGEWAV